MVVFAAIEVAGNSESGFEKPVKDVFLKKGDFLLSVLLRHMDVISDTQRHGSFIVTAV